MVDDRPADPVAAVLGQLNHRRFLILLACIRIRGEYTTRELRDRLVTSAASLPRDLTALELAGLLVADPPHTVARQGQPVRYHVAPQMRTVFADIAKLVAEAYD